MRKTAWNLTINFSSTDREDTNADNDLETVTTASALMREEVIAGKLLKIKEKYLVSHAVVDEVVELVESICDDMATQALASIFQTGEELGMDISSSLFQRLPQIFQELSFPLASIRTTYKQQSFIIKSLPYVVNNELEYRI